jgi:predicted nucleotidyltransferase
MFKIFSKRLSAEAQEQLVAAKLAWMTAVARPSRIILFGSAARGEMTDSSDIDLILIFVDVTSKEAGRQAIFRSRPRDDWPHDLLFFTEAEFAASVAKGGGAAYVAQQDGRTVFSRERDHEST